MYVTYLTTISPFYTATRAALFSGSTNSNTQAQSSLRTTPRLHQSKKVLHTNRYKQPFAQCEPLDRVGIPISCSAHKKCPAPLLAHGAPHCKTLPAQLENLHSDDQHNQRNPKRKCPNEVAVSFSIWSAVEREADCGNCKSTRPQSDASSLSCPPALVKPNAQNHPLHQPVSPNPVESYASTRYYGSMVQVL